MNTIISSTVDYTMIEKFLNSKKITGWSDSMINRTKKRLVVFCVDFSSNPEIMNNGLKGWKKQLEDRKLSERTIKEYMAAVVQFVEYAGITEIKGYNKRELDLTDREFGNLKVIKKVRQKKSAERSNIWECQCSCGNIVEIPANQLMKGYHTSCGCQKIKRLHDANQYIDGTSLKMVFSDVVRKDNTSGYKGVYLKKGRFAARIQYKGKRYYLGTYDKIEDAISVRKEAEKKIREACMEEYQR